jgi:hypothetical protein
MSRQELRASARDAEQLELGTTWNTCPNEGLCAWCLAQLDEDGSTLAPEERNE